MKKTLLKTLSVAALTLLVTACGEKTPTPQPQAKPQQPAYKASSFQCKQEGALAPRWTCIPEVEGFYAGVGVAEKSAAGMAHMRRVALMNGRSDLAQQIESDVKDKMEGFTRATGNGSNETVDKVTTAVTKQVSHQVLRGSKAVDMWQAPSGAIYLLVTVPKERVNKEVKEAVKSAASSYKNDNALWQQFQSKQALEALEKEFPSE